MRLSQNTSLLLLGLAIACILTAEARFLQQRDGDGRGGDGDGRGGDGERGNRDSKGPKGQNEGKGPGYVNFTYSEELTCGQCIMANHTFCVKGQEHMEVTDDSTRPETKCCVDATDDNCPEMSNSEWNCSSPYKDKTYAKYICPRNRDKCGSESEITMNETGESRNVTFRNLSGNDTCFVKINAKCGAISITPNSTDYTQLEYVEFTGAEEEATGDEEVKGSGKSKERPKDGMFKRGREFEEGNQDDNNDGRRDEASSGSYNQTRGGSLVWGRGEQERDQRNKTGLKRNETAPKCQDRGMYIAVSGTNRTVDGESEDGTPTSIIMTLQIESVDFESDYVDTGSFGVMKVLSNLAIVGYLVVFISAL